MLENSSFDTGLMLAVIVTLVVAWFVLNRATTRRRDQRFALLAELFGATVERESEWLSRFRTTIGGRDAEVRDQHISGGTGSAESAGASGWYLVTLMPLKRREWQLHEIEVRRGGERKHTFRLPRAESGDAEFDRDFSVHEAGGGVGVDWLDNGVRQAIRDLYALDLPVLTLSVEEGKLIHRIAPGVRPLDAQQLRLLLETQARIAVNLDRAVATRLMHEPA